MLSAGADYEPSANRNEAASTAWQGPSSGSSIASNELTARPSLRASLAEELGKMFAFEKGGGVKSVLLFAASVMTFSWFIDSLLPVLQGASQFLYGLLRGAAPPHHFNEPLAKLVLPASFFVIIVVLLIRRAVRNSQPRCYMSVVPDPHKGLIVQLSDYNSRGPSGQSAYISAEDIAVAARADNLDLGEVFKSNWGQLAFAVRYHAPVLRYCWIICTKSARGSSKDFSAAESMVKAIVKTTTGLDTACFKVELEDENDIGNTAQKVSNIYRGLSEGGAGLRSLDVIADFTGGTAAMSGGMILATLQEDREIEYLRRGVTLTADLNAADVQEQRIIISPGTSRGMVEMFARK